ncbi:MAG TPA: hypothetical protein VE244_15475 [Nitrososphaeraceae archaeon]|nr:hypothetical protein [Nitrososphaeraceae archaeon]
MNQAQTATATGTVVSVWRYPMKSMLEEKLNSSYVTERGLIEIIRNLRNMSHA